MMFVNVDRRYTRRWPTLALSLFLSLCVFVLFPFDIKTHLPQMLIIIEIQDSVVFVCSHFIGSTNTKRTQCNLFTITILFGLFKDYLKIKTKHSFHKGLHNIGSNGLCPKYKILDSVLD